MPSVGVKYHNFKFAYIKRNDDGRIVEAAIRYFEGEFIKHSKSKKLTFIRNKRLNVRGNSAQDANGHSIHIYDKDNFGEIYTDDELRLFCQSKMNSYTGWNPLPWDVIKGGG